MSAPMNETLNDTHIELSNNELSKNEASRNEAENGFEQFGFDSQILRGIKAAGFTKPRPIQAATIPAALEGRDVLGLAQTGTGKTAAFALPILECLHDDRTSGPQALILAPTRELATQIDAEIRTLARFTDTSVLTIFGGTPVRGQIQALRRNPQIVVGCPGRVLDLIGQRALRLDDIETLVLDEADHMFDMGFLPDLKRILKVLPEDRQNLLFSATMPKEIRGLADDLLDRPMVVELNDSRPAETIEHVLVAVSEDRKRDLLEQLLNDDECRTAIVFTRTKHRARRLAQQLDRAGFKAIALQGNMSQSQRDRAMEGFRKQRFDVLVATDIVARGIDVRGVSHVINYDVPNTPEAYTHRIGRTGRAELEGQAVTFATREDGAWLRATERKLGAPIPRRKVEGFAVETIGEGTSSGKKGGRPQRTRTSGSAGRKPSGDSSRPPRRGSRGRSRSSSRSSARS